MTYVAAKSACRCIIAAGGIDKEVMQKRSSTTADDSLRAVNFRDRTQLKLPDYSQINRRPACAWSRAKSGRPIAEAGVQMPPGVVGASCSRHAAASAIIFEVLP